MSRTDWEIRQDCDGEELDLVRGGRTRLREASESEIRLYLRKHLAPGEHVFFVERDGYRSEVTNGYARSSSVRDVTPTPHKSPSDPRRRAPVRMPLLRF